MKIAEDRPYYVPGRVKFCSSFAVPAPEMPTQKGNDGILYDFCGGARIFLPKGEWRILITDDESGNVLYDGISAGGLFSTEQKYFVKFGIKIWRRGEVSPCFEHTLDLKGRNIQIHFPYGALGDGIIMGGLLHVST